MVLANQIGDILQKEEARIKHVSHLNQASDERGRGIVLEALLTTGGESGARWTTYHEPRL
jgi:hypothetical protein